MSKAYECIKASYYDSAITKARTDLEEALIWAIEKRGQNAPKNGNVVQLYDQFKALCNMHRNKDMDRRIKDLLSGLKKSCPLFLKCSILPVILMYWVQQE